MKRRMNPREVSCLFQFLQYIPTARGREIAYEVVSQASPGLITKDMGMSQCCCNLGIYEMHPSLLLSGDILLDFPFATRTEARPEPDFRPISPISVSGSDWEEWDEATANSSWVTVDETGELDVTCPCIQHEGVPVVPIQELPRTSTPIPPQVFIETGIVLRPRFPEIMAHPLPIRTAGLVELHLPHEGLKPKHTLNIRPLKDIILLNGQPIALDPASVLYMDPVKSPMAIYGHWSFQSKLGDNVMAAISGLGNAHGQEKLVKELISGLTYQLSRGKVICYLQEVDISFSSVQDKCLGVTTVYHKRKNATTGARIVIQQRPVPINPLDCLCTVLHELAHAFSRCTKDYVVQGATGHTSSWVEMMGHLIQLMHSMPHGPALSGIRELISTLGYTWADVLFVWPYAHPN